MKITGIIRRVDDLGRIVIPREIRRQVFGKTDASGEPMEIERRIKNETESLYCNF